MASPALAAHQSPQKSSSPIGAIDRHDFAVQKNRKYASTGGGRAWTEDEVGDGNYRATWRH